MKKRRKDMILVLLVVLVLFGFPLFMIFTPGKPYTEAERRVLAQFPKVSAESLLSGKFMDEFDSYTMDQFPLRDGFRHLKASVAGKVFRKKDNNGYYVYRGYLSKLEYPLNEARLDRATDKMKELNEQFLAGTDCSVYLSIIPDKNYYLAPESGHLTMDYGKFTDYVRERTKFADYIAIFDLLSLEDYYQTDQHWRQEKIFPVARRLAAKMGTELSGDFRENALEIPFYGAYYGQAAVRLPEDEIRYLTADYMEDCVVENYGTGYPVRSSIYNMDKAHGRDPYEMFLSGSEPLIIIENPHAATDRELVLFRDSFGSSLAPLMLSGYSKITLVDLRYMRSEILGNFVDFTDQDVLFLYSTLVLNHS